MSIFVPSNESTEPYTKDQSDRKFERRDPTIVKSDQTPTSFGEYLAYSDVKNSYQLLGNSKVLIGLNSGKVSTGANSVILGVNCAPNTSGTDIINVGINNNLLGGMNSRSVCIGSSNSTFDTQSADSVIIGGNNQKTGLRSVHIGNSISISTTGTQGRETIVLGHQAGTFGMGNNCILVGTTSGAMSPAGTSSPANIIHLTATGTVNQVARVASACYIEPIRNITFSNSLTYNSSTGELGYQVSSERYKTNIRDFTDTEKIYNLSAKIYDFKAREGEQPEKCQLNQVSFIAEQVYENLPQCAYLNDKDEVENYSDKALIACLVQEMKKLKARIDQQDILINQLLPQDSPVLERS